MKKIINAFMLVAAVTLTGCNKSNRPSDLPPLYPCAMTIIQDGNPLGGATVSLVPLEEANAKYQASSITDESGTAVITTYGFDGVPAGRYKVCVWKTLIEGVEQYQDNYGETVSTTGTEYRTVETQYSDAETTPHEIEITGKKLSPKTFDVGKLVKIKK
jgi:hypothetical protein